MCAAVLTVVFSFALPACALFMALESVAASLLVVARRTYSFQEALKASETLGDYEPKVDCIPICYAKVTFVFLLLNGED